jgi:hypothetical protein
MIDDFRGRYTELFSPADQKAGTFTYVDTVGHEHEVPLTTVRVVYLPQVLHRVSEPRQVYELATQLRMRRVTPGPGGVIITDRRAEEAQGRATA